jgi:hypothetical protein
MNYKFNTPYLVERRIFPYSQTSRGANSFHFPSNGKHTPLSLIPFEGYFSDKLSCFFYYNISEQVL